VMMLPQKPISSAGSTNERQHISGSNQAGAKGGRRCKIQRKNSGSGPGTSVNSACYGSSGDVSASSRVQTWPSISIIVLRSAGAHSRSGRRVEQSGCPTSHPYFWNNRDTVLNRYSFSRSKKDGTFIDGFNLAYL
jgi:hypothetical protein